MKRIGDTSRYFVDRGGCVFLGPIGVVDLPLDGVQLVSSILFEA
jgi:hypothetical protein